MACPEIAGLDCRYGDGCPGRSDPGACRHLAALLAWNARQPGPRVVVRGHANSYTGYGQHTAMMAREVERAGVPVTWDAIDRDDRFIPLDPWVASRLSPGPLPGPRLTSTAPNRDMDLAGDVVLTMWESTRIDPAWAARLNPARCVVVPCRWNVAVLRESGVTAPIRVVPLGIDPAVYRPAGPPPPGPVVFGCAGRLSHGATRKGLADVISAFAEAFPVGGVADVRLDVKVWPDCRLEGTPDPRVRVIRDPLSDEGLAAWYRSLSCFVSASKSEGWGLQPHQAMACGRPVVAAVAGGHAEYMTADSCYPVEFDEAEVPPGYPPYSGLGRWFEPRRESLVARMREAYSDPDGRRRKGEAAALAAARFTWRRAGRELAAVLREFGLMPTGPDPEAARLGALADACPHGSGPCGCGDGPPRDCSRPGRPAKVRKSQCLDCQAGTWP